MKMFKLQSINYCTLCNPESNFHYESKLLPMNLNKYNKCNWDVIIVLIVHINDMFSN